MFNTFLWSLYGIARSNELIIGMWSSYSHELQSKKVMLLVSDIHPFLKLYWLTQSHPIKHYHLRCLSIEHEEVLNYSIITNNEEHYQIVISQHEDILLNRQPNLNLHLHKLKLNSETNLSRIYYDDCSDQPLMDGELELLEENFYFECFNVAKSLKKKEYWKAKVIETSSIKSCFLQLQKLTTTSLEKEDLTLEIKDCLEDFKMTTTWERLFYYMHIFEKTLIPYKQKSINQTTTKELKIFLNKIYEESKLH